MKPVVAVAVAAIFFFPSFVSAAPVVGRTVRLVYIAPSDRPVKGSYESAIKTATNEVVQFFESELESQIHYPIDPLVEVIKSERDAAWFGADTWGRSITTAGAVFNHADYVWVIYVDADVACGSLVGGTQGIAVLPANDLRGLTGEAIQPDCHGYVDSRPPASAGWTGGLGHEFGHLVGLPHPPGCDQGLASCDSNALMWLGYLSYPNTYLREDEKDLLLPDSACKEYTETNAKHQVDGRATVTYTRRWWTTVTLRIPAKAIT